MKRAPMAVRPEPATHRSPSPPQYPSCASPPAPDAPKKKKGIAMRPPCEPQCQTERLFPVGTAGFEPAAPCTPSKCATGLRHVPMPEADASGESYQQIFQKLLDLDHVIPQPVLGRPRGHHLEDAGLGDRRCGGGSRLREKFQLFAGLVLGNVRLQHLLRPLDRIPLFT